MGVTISLSDTSPKPGDEITVSWELVNDFTSQWYFKVDLYIDGSYVKNLWKGRIPGGSRRSGTTTITAQQGTHKVEAVAYLSTDGQNWMDYDSDSESYTTSGGFKVNSWSVSPSKKTAKPGEKVTVTVEVDWEAQGGVKFRCLVDAFGDRKPTEPVDAQTSPTSFSFDIKVPEDASPGDHTIAITLQAYY